jgi:hypothetical protein
MNPSQPAGIFFCALWALSTDPAHSQQSGLCPSSAASIEASLRKTMTQRAPGCFKAPAEDTQR